MFHNDYLQRILSINPDDRPSIDEIIEVIESPAPAPAPAPAVRPDSPIEKYLGGKSKRRRSKRHRKQKRSKRRQGTPFV